MNPVQFTGVIIGLENISGIKLRGASFLMHQVYDDEMTFKLVRAASSVSGLPVEVCLEEFGRHFLVYCQKNGYDQILRVLGSNLYDFLTNLDNLHDHLASIYPGMRAPSFRVTRHLEVGGAGAGAGQGNRSDELHKENASCSLLSGSMYLHYYSERAGLSPIVKGLVLAVAREFFQTNIQVTVESEPASVKTTQQDKHVVLRIDRQPLPAEQTDEGETSPPEIRLDSSTTPEEQQLSRISLKKKHLEQPQLIGKTSNVTLNYDSLSTNAHHSIVNNEIMMQAFPFHVIFDRQFKLVQVGHSLLRLTSRYWQEREYVTTDLKAELKTKKKRSKSPVKLSDLFLLVRPKIELDFDAIADHTNQVFVVRTKEMVLNANRTSSGGGQAARQRHQVHQDKQPLFSPSSAGCPLSRMANLKQQQRRGTLPCKSSSQQEQHKFEQTRGTGSSIEEVDESVKLQEGQLAELSEQASLRLKGQMIILSGGQLCLYLCSPRVDHLGQLMECGVRMSDFALHDRARELMLMSHTHKEDREAVKKLDQASNDLKKMDTKLRLENKRTEEVLHNIFPAKIATLLSHGHKVESESFDLVSCLYSDIIGFTKMCGSENVRPIDIVRLLNTMYLQFDNLTNIHQVFKVETIGDAYVVVGGLPEPAEDHADRCVKMGLDMVKVIGSVRSPADNQPIQMRIGIHSGPVMAGIVGIRVPRYSLFGNTTTLANQLETHGVAGKIHISDFTLKNLIRRDRFVIEDNPNEINGIPFVTYFVTNYLGDENETLKHERILEEELIKDFQLMGNAELELVDDEQAASVSQDYPSSSGQLYTNPEHSSFCTSTHPLSQPEGAQGKNGRPAGKVLNILSESLANFSANTDALPDGSPQLLCDLEDQRQDLKRISNELTSYIIVQALEQVASSSTISSKVEQIESEASLQVCPLCQGRGSLDHSPRPNDFSSPNVQIHEAANQRALLARKLLDFLLSRAPVDGSELTPASLDLLLDKLQAERRKLHLEELPLSSGRQARKKNSTNDAHSSSGGAGFGHVISREIQRIKRMDTLKSQKMKRRHHEQPNVPPPPPPENAQASVSPVVIVEESEDEDEDEEVEDGDGDTKDTEDPNENEKEKEAEKETRGFRASLASIANDLLGTASSTSQQSRKKRFSFVNPFARLTKSPISMRRRQHQHEPHPSATNSRQQQQQRQYSNSSRCSCLKSSESNQSFANSSSSFQAHPSALSAPLSSKAN